MIEVQNIIRIYEINDKDEGTMPSMFIKSHWVQDKMVVLVVDGKTYTVLAKDLRAAIDNAVNTSRY